MILRIRGWFIACGLPAFIFWFLCLFLVDSQVLIVLIQGTMEIYESHLCERLLLRNPAGSRLSIFDSCSSEWEAALLEGDRWFIESIWRSTGLPLGWHLSVQSCRGPKLVLRFATWDYRIINLQLTIFRLRLRDLRSSTWKGVQKRFLRVIVALEVRISKVAWTASCIALSAILTKPMPHFPTSLHSFCQLSTSFIQKKESSDAKICSSNVAVFLQP